MEQMVLNIEEKSILSNQTYVPNSLNGGSVVEEPSKSVPKQVRSVAKKKKTELDLAIEDVRKGNLRTFESVDELMNYLNA